MKAAFLSLACLLFTRVEGLARLGETLDECVTRYGAAVGSSPATLPASDPKAVLFTKSGISVQVEFHEGVAWKLTFRKTNLTAPEVEALLLANSGVGLWTTPLKYGVTDYRRTEDKKRLSVFNPDRGTVPAMLEVMKSEFVEAAHLDYVVRIESSKTTPEAQPLKKAGSPLSGF